MMTKSGAATLLALLVNTSFAATTVTLEQKQEIREKIEPYLSIKHPYPFPKQYPEAPAQCQLVHINHLGRHGSRHMTSESDFQENVADVLLELNLVSYDDSGQPEVADNLAITGQGKILVKRILAIRDIYTSTPRLFASVTVQGKDEQRLQGSRLFLSTGMRGSDLQQQIASRRIRAESTVKTRTHTSRAAFLAGLGKAVNIRSLDSFVDMVTPQPGEIDRQLLFYDHCQAYLDRTRKASSKGKGKIKAELEQSYVQQAFYMLSNIFVIGLPSEKRQKLVKLVYKLCQLDANLDYELGICSMLLKQGGKNNSLQALNQATNIEQFYKRGPASEFEDINRTMAVDLLTNWLDTTEAGINNPSSYFVNLRFAHDSTLLRFEQILDLISPTSALSESGNVIWKLSTLAPMSASLVWQTFACESPETSDRPVYKTRMLLNDVITPFPITGCQSSDGLCDWNKVKSYYQLRTRDLSLEQVCGELVIQEKTDE